MNINCALFIVLCFNEILDVFLIQAFFEKAEIKQDEKQPNHLVVAMTSDRGLCGGVHSSISKAIRAAVPDKPVGTTTKIVCIGDKSRSVLGRYVDQIC